MKMERENPKQRGSQSRERYEDYKEATTLSEMLEFGALPGDITNDFCRGYIHFDTSSRMTVQELINKTKESFEDDDQGNSNSRINGVCSYEESIRMEFMSVGVNHIENMTHNQQTLLRDALGNQSLHEFAHMCVNNIMFNEPTSVKEALSSENAAEWRAAMDEEIANLIKFNCFKRVTKADAIKHGKLLQSKWVFKQKFNADGTHQRFRARLVAKGFLQQQNIDFYETFSPVFSYTSLRMVMAHSAANDLRLDQWDLKNAFLQQRIDVDHMYMAPPDGYDKMMDDGVTPAALHCLGSIYGIKQASRLLHTRLSKFLKSQGYRQLISDQCVYVKAIGTDDEEIVCTYVDDIILATKRNNEERRAQFNDMIKREFEVSPWTKGECDWILNMNVKRDWELGTLHLSQEAAIIKLATKFGQNNTKSASTPMDSNLKLSKGEIIIPSEDFDYMSAVGGLLYISMTTRPDISYPVGVLSRFMSCPGAEHVKAAKRVISYLFGTKTYGIRYSRSEPKESVGAPHSGHRNPQIFCHTVKSSQAKQGSDEFKEVMCHTYVDADLAGDRDTMRSTTGFGILVYGGVISWMARLQPTVALSTAEAETNAAVEAVKMLCHIRMFLEELGVKQTHPTTLYEDNNAVMSLVAGAESSKRSKHYMLKTHFLIEKKLNGIFDMKKVITKEQMADIWTKPLNPEPFNRYRNWMGVINCDINNSTR